MMNNKTRFILISNYTKDNQESMQRYALNLRNDLRKKGIDVEVWYPRPLLGLLVHNTEYGLKKWLGYVDKWILNMVLLKLKVLKESKKAFYHICDHSNAPYLQVLPTPRSGITCHDVLAIQGALGYNNAHCQSSKIGVLFQKWIFNNLKKAKKLAAVSNYTLNQLLELCNNVKPDQASWEVIYNTFNADFRPMEISKRKRLLDQLGIYDKSYILHVGSNLPRKNRSMLIHMCKFIANWEGLIVFAGAPLEPSLENLIKEMNYENRVLNIIKPPHEDLVALYSGCLCFVFPSYSEGFGWPLIEAQACAAPVLTSEVDPMPEVSGGAAVHKDPHKPQDFANGLFYFLDENNRDYHINLGLDNCKRYDSEKLINNFLKLYYD